MTENVSEKKSEKNRLFQIGKICMAKSKAAKWTKIKNPEHQN